jgi:hypothetical protein
MNASFTKLMSSITESTVWGESSDTRVVWITMLAMADQHGRVLASVPGLARRAAVPLEACERALNRFQEPDPYSRTPDYEGRRIQPIDGGWRLLNHAKYREMRDQEARREYQREWDRTKRVRPTKSDISDTIRPQPTQAEVEAEAEGEEKKICVSLEGDAPLRELSAVLAPRPPQVTDRIWNDFLAVRRSKRAPLTKTALQGIVREASKAGITVAEALQICCERNWQSFNASWDWKQDGETSHGSTKDRRSLAERGEDQERQADAVFGRL